MGVQQQAVSNVLRELIEDLCDLLHHPRLGASWPGHEDDAEMLEGLFALQKARDWRSEKDGALVVNPVSRRPEWHRWEDSLRCISCSGLAMTARDDWDAVHHPVSMLRIRQAHRNETYLIFELFVY